MNKTNINDSQWINIITFSTLPQNYMNAQILYAKIYRI